MRALLAFCCWAAPPSPTPRAGRAGRPPAKLRLATQHEQAASPALNARQWLFAADNDAANLAGPARRPGRQLAGRHPAGVSGRHPQNAGADRPHGGAAAPARQSPPILLGRDADTWPCCRASSCASTCWTSSSKKSAPCTLPAIRAEELAALVR
ncbi:MAG: hypothetical protein U1E47_01345 [Rivihabitans pingtungensis]